MPSFTLRSGSNLNLVLCSTNQETSTRDGRKKEFIICNAMCLTKHGIQLVTHLMETFLFLFYAACKEVIQFIRLPSKLNKAICQNKIHNCHPTVSNQKNYGLKGQAITNALLWSAWHILCKRGRNAQLYEAGVIGAFPKPGNRNRPCF